MIGKIETEELVAVCTSFVNNRLDYANLCETQCRDFLFEQHDEATNFLMCFAFLGNTCSRKTKSSYSNLHFKNPLGPIRVRFFILNSKNLLYMDI